MRENEAIRFFSPNRGQALFLEEIKREGAWIVFNGSGNGAGKTYILIAIAAALCFPDLAPECFASPIFKNWPHPKRIRIASTPKELEEIGSIQNAVRELFPAGRYTSHKNGKSYPSQFVTQTGWIIDVFSYEQDKSEMAGPTIGLLLFNEPPPEGIFREGIARMRKGGLVLGAMTSLQDNPWIVDGIFNKANGKDIRVVYSDIEENCKEHGTNGTLEHAQIERILGQYDPDEREARKTGKPLSLSGRIYKSFDRGVHVARDEFGAPKSGVTRYLALDPAIGKPCAIVFAFVGADSIVRIYDEFPNHEFEGSRDSNQTVPDYVGIIKAKEDGVESVRIIDRHFANARRTMGGLTLRQEFAEHDMHFQDSYNMDAQSEVETGILKVKEYLKYDPSKPIDALNRPKIIISPNCHNTISAFEKWGRNPDTFRPKEEYKDFMDCVRYLLMANPTHETDSNWIAPKTPVYGVGT